MGEKRTKQTSKLKAKQREQYDKENRNFTPDEIKFILEQASSMTLDDLADKMECSPSEIEAIIKQYNSAGNHAVRGAYIIPGKDNDRMKGVVIGTQASSQLADKDSKGAMVQPKAKNPNIFEIPKLP